MLAASKQQAAFVDVQTMDDEVERVLGWRCAPGAVVRHITVLLGFCETAMVIIARGSRSPGFASKFALKCCHYSRGKDSASGVHCHKQC